MIDTFERRRNFVVPTLMAVMVVPLALLLMIVGARSPYTHVNLMSGYDPGYTRTDQVFVGMPIPLQGGMSAMPLANDPVERGYELFVAKGCASCHGVDGHGGIVGPPIAGASEKELRVKTKVGPGGMPAFAPEGLSNEDLSAIAAYLKAMSN